MTAAKTKANATGGSALNIVWLRRDLRLKDNHALAQALKAGGAVQCFFIFDPEILEKLEDQDDARVEFIWTLLSELQVELQSRGGDLWVFHGQVEKVFHDLFQKNTIQAVYSNHDYEPSAIARDAAVEKLCAAQNIQFFSFKDQVIFEKNEIQTDAQTPYSVYGAYKKKWLKTLTPALTKPYASDGALLTAKVHKVAGPSLQPTLEDLGFKANLKIQIPKLQIPKSLIKIYDQQRDFPAVSGTTRLGLHLRFGTISVRELVSAAKELNDIFLSELIWREFFMQILFHFPHTVTNAFRPEYDKMPWRSSDADFQAWCEGRTGVPLVDAGMRELNQTGFMHNRVRMITASYLIKHLLIDWRKGEAYFARKLLDYDQSANVGNWQWVAGSGCDAAPYFRIFNPEIQMKRFDPKKEYIRKWVPEFETARYPKALVEHVEGRDRAMKAYFSITGKKPIKQL